MKKENLNVPALIALGIFIAGGLVALYLDDNVVAAALIGAAVGQLGPQPVRAGK